jgi:hypothetical protein
VDWAFGVGTDFAEFAFFGAFGDDGLGHGFAGLVLRPIPVLLRVGVLWLDLDVLVTGQGRAAAGRTSKGERMPWLRMLAANSLRAESSKNRRGLVFDSVRMDSGRSRYSVAVFAIVIIALSLGAGLV